MSGTARRHCAIFTDGGARGNPGPAAAGGVIIADNGTVVAKISEYLGIATNNVAEYRALILALQRALDAGFREVDVCLDSELIVKQLSGEYRVKDAKIVPLYQRVRRLLSQFGKSSIQYVPRERNKRADKLVNAALDAHMAEAQQAGTGDHDPQQSLL
jgi:ribonuclease HI